MRIITHGGCMDGFASAYLYKKHLHKLLFKEDLKNFQVIGVTPKDIELQGIELTPTDIVLDLPRPRQKVKLWIDHHSSNDPKDKKPNFKYFFETTLSCAALIFKVAKQHGLKPSKELQEFITCMDIMDGATYTKKQIKECYYHPKNLDNLTALQKVHMLSSVFHTRDRILNELIFKDLIHRNLGDAPHLPPTTKGISPKIFYHALLHSYEIWREQVDDYLEYHGPSKCVVQDDRLVDKTQGVPDRFYVFMKYDDSVYSLNLRDKDDQVRIGIGSNIFYKDRCQLDIGKLCKDVGKKFGSGSGGGHKLVGGCIVDSDKANQAKKYILTKMTESIT